jgi:hypothetical protein
MSTGRFSASDRELTVPSLTRSFVDHGWNDPLLEPWTNLRGLIYPYESPWRVSSWRVSGRPALVRFCHLLSVQKVLFCLQWLATWIRGALQE